MIPIFALMVVVIGGMVALALDIGHVFQQRQALQNTATSAAVAGAYQVVTQSGTFDAIQDKKVALEMKGVIASLGYTVANIDSNGTYSPPPTDTCKAGYPPSQVYLQAEYLNRDTNPSSPTYNQNVAYHNSAGAVEYVGQWTPGPSTTLTGVKVVGLGGCVPAFFASILGRQNFTAARDAQAASIVASVPLPGSSTTPTNYQDTPTGFQSTNTTTPTPITTATSTPTSTRTGTPTSTATADTSDTPSVPTEIAHGADAPFYVYGTSNGGNPMLFAKGSSSYSTGDKVTLFGNSSDWAGGQFAGSADGITGTPGGLTLHDSSIIGCLDASSTSYINGFTIDTSTFNHGGDGHCAVPTLHLGEVVMIPTVKTVCKNGDCRNGGWTVQITAFILVQLTLIDPPSSGGNSGNGHVIQGMIVGVVSDPYGVVQAPPSPTATATSTATTIPTSTRSPTATPTPIPPS
jgi:Flp pilus assembly protein TadG